LLQGANDAASRSLLAAIEVTLGRIALTTEIEKRERSDNEGADHDLTLARRSFETAVQLDQALLRQSPKDPGVVRQLALAHIALGDALSQRGCAVGPCSDALASYNAGLGVLDSFSLDRKSERADLSYARFLVLFARAALLSDMRRHDDALADIKQAEAIIRVLSALDADNRQWSADVGKTLLTKGRYEDAVGHDDRAVTAYAEACTLLGMLSRNGLDHADWVSDYEACKLELNSLRKRTSHER
jgi:tetratricopeptide (TPR) repeat protein